MDVQRILSVTILMLSYYIDSAVSICAGGEDLFTCGATVVCYGGVDSQYTADDVLCMLRQEECDVTYLYDTCRKCEQNPSQYEYGSSFMDCSGQCYEQDQLASMKVVDMCGVCDGTNSTCNPKVSALDKVLVPDTANSILNITGTGLRTQAIQILLLYSVADEPVLRRKRQVIFKERGRMETENGLDDVEKVRTSEINDKTKVYEVGHNRLKRSTKVVEMVFPVLRVYDETTLEIKAEDVPAGVYEVGARTGNDGTEFQDHTGPSLTVYAESDYTVDSLSPTEQDLDGTDTVTVTLQLSTTSESLSIGDMYDLTNEFQCIFSESANIAVSSDANGEVAGTFSRPGASLESAMEVPDISQETWACASFDGIHIVGCQSITFFETAPFTIDATLVFMDTGDGLFVTFNKPVHSAAVSMCSAYFTDVTTLGEGSRCHFNEAGDRLSVRFGDGSTAALDDIIELKSGLMAREGSFKRQSEAVNLTLTLVESVDAPMETIEIAPRGSWPVTLTASAESPLILEIQILVLPANRPPESIIWTVNDVEQDSAMDSLELELNVTATGRYQLNVTATDFLGGESIVMHTITKVDTNLPTVVFVPEGVTEARDGSFEIHPNTVFTIHTNIYYTSVDNKGLDSFNFQWERNGENTAGNYFYKSVVTETTIDMCDDRVVYSVVVSAADDESTNVEYSITMIVVCRDPVTRISGNEVINVHTSHDDVTIVGGLSHDPDGGMLTYNWTCSTLGDTDCIDAVTGVTENSTSLPRVTISPSRMTEGKQYAITLTTSVEKSGEVYQSSDKVIIAIQDGDNPVVRWVTLRSRFRHDAPIMIKAHVGTDVTVEWRFVPNLELYDWTDAGNRTIGKASKLTEGFAWYTIKEGVLTPGSWYRMELNVTGLNGMVTTELYDIYIYQLLRGCSVEGRAMVELEESTISLQSCAADPDVTWRSTTCTAAGKGLLFTQGLTFIVPIFKPETIAVVITCKIVDSLKNILVVNSTEITVTKAADHQQAHERIEQLKNTGNLLGALTLMSEITDTDIEEDKAVNNEAIGLISQILESDPSPDELRRALNCFSKLKIDRIELVKRNVLAENLIPILGTLCAENLQDGENRLSVDEIRGLVANMKPLMESKRALGPQYRVVEDKIACIKLKLMQNEDYESVEFDDGSRHSYLVNTLDDVKKFGLDLEFSEDLKSRFRDQWKCGESEVCHGVGIKVEEYVSDPPDLAFGRTDQGCTRYVVVDLYNPKSGERISVKELTGTVNLNLGDQCPRAQCWYYDEFLGRYGQQGVITVTTKDGSIQCQTNHLTTFTVKSEPEVYKGLNLPYIVAVCVGALCLLLSVVILVKLLLFIKHQANAVTGDVEDEKHFNLKEFTSPGEDFPVKRRKRKE